MSVLYNILLEPGGDLVAWDYCLENGILLYDMPPMQYWLFGACSKSNTYGFSESNQEGRTDHKFAISFSGEFLSRSARTLDYEYSRSGYLTLGKSIHRLQHMSKP